jgi:tRNA threonylcarbamoyladenosine biosynthesis protein TsaB
VPSSLCGSIKKMSIIINIDTATETAHISIAKNGIVLQDDINVDQKDHAAFLQVAIKNLLHRTGVSFKQVNAIAVTIGPGSYTGLRVGLASAKGLCYALKIPLITMGTLDVLARAALNSPDINTTTLLCPMIDARRMEVFAAVFTPSLQTILPACALVLNETSFEELLADNMVTFFGNGSGKWQKICHHANAKFINAAISSIEMSQLSLEKYNKNIFSDLAYTEPTYIKEFHFN